eukprot:3445977-Alexandrium_andersonii.AAC.1
MHPLCCATAILQWQIKGAGAADHPKCLGDAKTEGQWTSRVLKTGVTVCSAQRPECHACPIWQPSSHSCCLEDSKHNVAWQC